MAAGDIPKWPPTISESQLESLTLLATTYALSHGLVYLPVADKQPPAPTSTIHAPISLFPSPIPRKPFNQAKELQSIYNTLYSRIATQEEFLDHVMGEIEGVGKVDEFTGQLWRRWKKLRDENKISQPLQLGLFRSDYMIHTPSNEQPSLKQVEFNTISSSFGTLSERSAQMHRYLLKSTGYYESSPYLKEENLPPNQTTAGLAEGIATAHKAYNTSKQVYNMERSSSSLIFFSNSARVLFVVQDNERNVFDQRWLEYELLETHSIHVLRQTFDQLATSAKVDPSTSALQLHLPGSSTPYEISVIYFRAGYTPNDYPTSAHYDIRYLLESSRAIKCPSIPLQLAGGKKVQEVLTKPGVLEQFLRNDKFWNGEVYSTQQLEAIRETWMDMWALDEGEGDSGVVRARDESSSLVLKPQREGGGNNVYKESIPSFLDSLPVSERQAWIAMKLISTQQGLGNYLVRAGGGTESAGKSSEVISELGIFGWSLFGGSDGQVVEKEVGWLLRTKGKDSNEGGVAAGFSVLDSIVLID
ncbi:glutathione synthase [Abortiporus biennis]|nr:glutathione synthase [Abortiporus biennis]